MEENVNQEFSPLLREYEKINKSVKHQIKLYEAEHESLRSEIIKLINDNKLLSTRIKDLIHEKYELLNNGSTQIDFNLIDNLRSQISVLSKEKSTTFDLWQNSLQTIDYLEQELTCYRDASGVISKIDFDKEQEKYIKEINELKHELKLSSKQVQENSHKYLNHVESRTNELAQALDGHRAALSQIQDKEIEISDLNDRLNTYMINNDGLKCELEKRDQILHNLITTDHISKAKVLESVLIAEEAIAEKDAAVHKTKAAKEEINELNTTITQIIKEADEKITNEVELIKKQYNANINQLIQDLKSIQTDLTSKILELDKVTRECQILEDELARIRKGNVNIDESTTSKLLILEKNLEATFQKLLISERKNVQISAEMESTKMDIEQLTNTFERDTKTMELEKQNMERKIKTLQTELLISNKFVEEYVVQIKALNARMANVEDDMKDKLDMKEKMFDDMLLERVNEIRKDHLQIQNKLELHWKSEHDLNLRWQSETNDITDKLQGRIKELKAENRELRTLIDNFYNKTSTYV